MWEQDEVCARTKKAEENAPMKRKISRCLAGMLAAVFMMSSGGFDVSAQGAIPEVWASASETEIPKEQTPETSASDEQKPEEPSKDQTPEVSPENPGSEDQTPEEPPKDQTPEDQPAADQPPEDQTPEDQTPEEPKQNEDVPENVPDADSLPDDKPSEVQQRQGTKQMTGAVEVLITAGVPVKEAQVYQVELKGPKSDSQKAVLEPAAEGALDAPQVSARFPELEAGTYELKVSGSGYAAYTQTIQVDALAYRVQLYTGEAAFGSGNAQPGLLAKGDLNGDGKLDNKDTELLIDAIDAGRYEEAYDLYGDGKVDLKDLNHLTRLMGVQKKSTLEKFIPLDAAEFTCNGGTIQSGDAGSFLRGESGLTVSVGTSGTELMFDFSQYKDAPKVEGIFIGAPENKEYAVAEGLVTIDTEDGTQLAAAITGGSAVSPIAAVTKPFDVTVHEDGSVSIDLKGQIAVKKITFRITKTANAKNLAEISKVEFVNDMESRIPEPEMNIPKNIKTEPGNKSFTVGWDKQNNVMAYEISITKDGQTDYRRTTGSSDTIQQFLNDKLENNVEYEVRVQSLNGEWKSGFSESVTVIPKVDKKPAAPESIKITGGYRCLDVRWKKMKDTDSYRLFYREKGSEHFEEINNITGSYCQVTGLKDDTVYEVYLTGVNELGEGPASNIAEGRTISGLIPAKLPEYKLINTSNGEGKLSAHIVSAVIGGGNVSMVDSPLDKEEGSALGAFDNRYASYIDRKDWDYGAAYPAEGKGVTVQLDDTYEIGMITLAQPMDEGELTRAYVMYWDENGKKQVVQGITVSRKRSNNRNYYLIKFPEAVKTSKLQLGVGQTYGYYQVAISEIRFHLYDSLEQDILGLFADDLFITLRDGVNQKTLDELQKRLDTPDPASGEYHPERDALQEELDAAKAILATEGLGDVIQVNPNINAQKDRQISLGGLMGRQPLGVTAAAGDRLVVYVGNPGMKSGAKANVNLVFTQQHAESDGLSRTVGLKIGRNEITVPQFFSMSKERGGPIYIQYLGNNPEDQYAVRVSGGNTFPILNVYRVSDAEREARIQKYAEELKNYTAKLEETHRADHESGRNENSNFPYDSKTCILNTTDIVTDYMMLSVPASQIQAGLGEDAVGRLSASVKAMDQMMLLFYEHKGLTNTFAEGTPNEIIEKNHLPYQCLNIRYMTMFDGAFMYASGDHVGIEWGSVPGLIGSVPVQAEDNGKYISGRYFGWGIAHEIGHQINQGAYAHAEVTNNYFSILAQAHDSNDTVRFKYPEVFKKVTSGTTGYAGNVFTQLGMYWQLHLAYDEDYNYKMYGNWQEMQEHLFFARVDRYARDAASAPAPKGIKLDLTGGRNQNLMRLASAAAERNLLTFFERWGMVPDSTTRSYAGQFEEEKRAVYYADDTARVYRMEHSGGDSKPAKPTAKVETTALGTVTFTITSSSPETIQGYEITRVFTEWGEERREIAGFTQDGTFTDQPAFAAGHVIAYEIRAVDKWLNYSEADKVAPVKITGSGVLDKSSWTVETNMSSEDDKENDEAINDNEYLPCETVIESAITRAANKDYNDDYTGSVSGEDPYILLKLNRVEGVAAISYDCASDVRGGRMTNYRIEISTDGETYKEVDKGTWEFAQGEQRARVDFADESGQLLTYDTAFVKLTAVGQAGKAISVTEIDLYGPSGDNVEISADGIGILSDDYYYDNTDQTKKIPKGSIVFTGAYKGNPAYNVVALYDQNGSIVGGTDSSGTLTAHQIILMNPPKDGQDIGDVSDGKWIYWFEPGEAVTEDSLPEKVRTELYRVDNALTNEGQRLVSDTIFVEVPQKLPPLKFE